VDGDSFSRRARCQPLHQQRIITAPYIDAVPEAIDTVPAINQYLVPVSKGGEHGIPFDRDNGEAFRIRRQSPEPAGIEGGRLALLLSDNAPGAADAPMVSISAISVSPGFE
jgi:hypothetical protein